MLSSALVHSLMAICDLVSLEAMAAEDSGTDFDLDAELGSIGVGNLLAAAVCATPNYVQLGPSVTCFKLTRGGGARAGPFVAVMTAASLWHIGGVVAAVPRPVIGAFMIWLGLHFVRESGVDVLLRTADPVDVALVCGMACARGGRTR